MARHFNLREQKYKRKALRKTMSKAETVLWKQLSRRQVLGFKFRRQYGVDQFIVDFYCPELRLAIEVDGDTHFGAVARKRDAIRQRHIESFGIQFLRVTNDDVLVNLEGVKLKIYEIVRQIQRESP